MPIHSSSPQITPAASLDVVIESLEELQTQVGSQNNELANQYLLQLYASLRNTQQGVHMLEAPLIEDGSSLSTADIITLLLTESKRTKEHVIGSAANEIKLMQAAIRAKYADSITKLNEASEKQKKADNLKKGLDIFKWCMLAVSIILIAVSAVLTVVTFGSCTPLLIASIALMTVTVGMIIASYVPVDGDKTAMDLATEKMAKAIADGAKERYKESYNKDGRKWDDLTEDEQQEALNKAESEGIYGAMGVMISIQIIIAAVMIAVTLGAAAGSSATNVANTGTNAAKSGIQAAIQAAKQAIQQNLNAIIAMVKKISIITQMMKAGAEISAAGVRIDQSITQAEATEFSAEADYIKSLAKFMDGDSERLEKLIEELLAAIVANEEAVGTILKEDAGARRRMDLNLLASQTA